MCVCVKYFGRALLTVASIVVLALVRNNLFIKILGAKPPKPLIRAAYAVIKKTEFNFGA